MIAVQFHLNQRLHPFTALLSACALTAALIIGGCGDEGEAPPAETTQSGPPAMGFQVDRSLLGERETFEAFDVSVRPPRGWASLPEDQVAAVAQAATPDAATQPSEASTAEPLAVFVGPQDASGQPATLMVSGVEAGMADRTEALLREAFGEVKAGDFRVGSLPVRMFNVAPPEMVSYKVLIRPDAPREGRVLQLDYVSSREGYAEVARAIESSIGSLRGSGRSGADGEREEEGGR